MPKIKIGDYKKPIELPFFELLHPTPIGKMLFTTEGGFFHFTGGSINLEELCIVDKDILPRGKIEIDEESEEGSLVKYEDNEMMYILIPKGDWSIIRELPPDRILQATRKEIKIQKEISIPMR